MERVVESGLDWRIQEVVERVERGKEEGVYYYQQAVEKLDGARVWVDGRPKLMFATYSYLGLLNHPRINAAAQAAIREFGTGTHGVRLLGGTITLHKELEERIARFDGTADAIVFSSGYVTNLSTISTLVGRNDAVICDKWDHASIVDGCLLSRAEFVRFRHNDMADLERCLARLQERETRLVVVDAVYSMDGDIAPLPELVELCRRYRARLMVDEAHSLGVLGRTGRGIEEHFGMEGAIDIKMGTLSKTIPAIGGYIAADADTITYLKHSARAFVFSAALPPAVCAAALAAFDMIEEEGAARRAQLQCNVERFAGGLRRLGFDIGRTQSPIIPVIVGSDDNAIRMTKLLQDDDIFALPVLPPAVPTGTSRIRANVTAAHTAADIDEALAAFARAGQALGLIPS